MQPQAASNSGPGGLEPAPEQHQISGGYRHLLTALASRAHRFGSRDPEAAAQEALTRSWENTKSKAALEFYFRKDVAADVAPPTWSLDQLLAWLHTVLRYVVSEERDRVAYRVEVSFDRDSDGWDERSIPEPSDPGADQLHQLLQRELESILSECFPKLDSE